MSSLNSNRNSLENFSSSRCHLETVPPPLPPLARSKGRFETEKRTRTTILPPSSTTPGATLPTTMDPASRTSDERAKRLTRRSRRGRRRRRRRLPSSQPGRISRGRRRKDLILIWACSPSKCLISSSPSGFFFLLRVEGKVTDRLFYRIISFDSDLDVSGTKGRDVEEGRREESSSSPRSRCLPFSPFLSSETISLLLEPAGSSELSTEMVRRSIFSYFSFVADFFSRCLVPSVVFQVSSRTSFPPRSSHPFVLSDACNLFFFHLSTPTGPLQISLPLLT